MNILKRAIALLLVLIVLFSLFACEEYTIAPGIPGGNGGGGGGSDGGGYTPPVLNDDPTDDFVVTLHADGEPYSPRMEMYVNWSNGTSVHTAKVDENGVARIDGLDGDYRVTLSAVPNEYAYDPNTNYATNDRRSIVLELYTLNRLTGSGTGIYDCYNFRSTGVYSAVIDDPDDAIYFQYAPDMNGTYTIESWVDTAEDNVNPYIDVYGGSSQYKYYIKTTDDGGSVGSYTINFLHTVQIADENISDAGQVVYTFAVKAESKNGKYPITITFAVKRNGGFELPDSVTGAGAHMVVPEFDFSGYNVADHEYGAEYVFKNPEYAMENVANTVVFDDSLYKLWAKEDGGDGFYHVYDEEKYAATDGYGPILYAHITTNTRFLDRAFTNIEYNASGETINNALSISGANYKHFIEGYTYLSTYGNINGGSYYCVSDCPCHKIDNPVGWACTAECQTCDSDCRRCPEELVGHEGYQAYVNSDGMVAVTAELQQFLSDYCKKQKYFYDGKGYFDRGAINGISYQAVGDSGWLFACGYYELA